MLKNVLIVEDQPELRQVVRLFLEMFYHATVTEAHNGQEGLDYAAVNPDFDLIITDLDMPNINGLNMVKALRDIEAYQNTPVFMITSEGEEYRQIALDAGVTKFFNKPMEPATLTPAVDEYLSRKQ